MFREQLILKALAALCEIADECGERPAAKSLGLRFILAYTFVAAGADPKLKWIWDAYWKDSTAPVDPARPMDDYLRGTGARSAFNGICREIGYPPDPDFLARLRRQRRPGSSPGIAAPPPAYANDEPRDDGAA